MMDLPETISTPLGLSVRRAGSWMLSELLLEWDDVLRHYLPELWADLRPGADEEEVHQAFDQLDLEPTAEMIEWWTWRDGCTTDGSRFAPLSLDEMVENYQTGWGGGHVGPRSDGWVDVQGGSDTSWALRVDDSGGQLVRALDREQGTTTAPQDTRTQVVSLCTPIAWWIEGFHEGWYQPRGGYSARLDRDKLPRERLTTLLF